MKRFTVVLLSLCLLFAGITLASGQQAAPKIEMVTGQAGSSALSYPRLTGMPNLFVQDKINSKIAEKGNIAQHEVTMNSPAPQGARGVNVWCEAYILSGSGEPAVFSVVVFAEGKMPGGRLGYEATPMMFDLKTGDEISADALWTDSFQAQVFFDSWVENEPSLALNTYVDPYSALPVPIDRAMLTPYGINIYYPPGTYVLLSDRAGVFSFYFHEVKTILNTGESSLLFPLDAWADVMVNAETAGRVFEAAASGQLPGIENVIGRGIAEVVAQFKELTDSEAFLSGERYVLEDARFRDVYVTVLDGVTVEGILARRMNLFGLIIGEATKAACIKTLGEPLLQLVMDEPLAQQYAMQIGTAAIYQAGDYRIMLAFNADDVLSTIYLANAQ